MSVKESVVMQATRAETFQELVAAKYEIEHLQRTLNEKVIKKCMEEGWSDCLTIQWSKIAQRSR